MALPLAPSAVMAFRLAAFALAVYALARSKGDAGRDQRAEDALDDLPEGAELHRVGDGLRAKGRMRRAFRLGPDGRGVEIDAAGFGRIRFRRI